MGCGGSAETVGEKDIERAKASLKPFKQELQAALRDGMRQGPEYAMTACRDKAPEIAAGLSVDGVQMGRTSHRLRNAANAPEPWLRPLLAEYVERGDDKTPRALRLKDGSVGYVEPIYVQPLCLKCHGDDIDASIKGKLAELYPEDEATGFASGEFRGVFWVKLSADQPSS
jgi:hypothetical protein